ncbi:MAG TPA: hemolysin III family protein [Gemmataceae bacterium]|nr:hemolysin III family protein [Gemmataceae bacterium]
MSGRRNCRATCRFKEKALLARFDLYSLPGFHDPVSSISHLLGAIVFALLTQPLLRRGRGDPVRVAYLGVFAFSSVFLFSMSAAYHMLPFPSGGRDVLLRLDYSAIFVLIAGTFTPAHGILFRGPLRWGPLWAIWIAAITGLTLKTIFLEYLPEWLGLTFYLGLGWVGVFSAYLLWQRYGLAFIAPLLWGALAYTVGSVMEFLGWLTIIPGVFGPHELMHILVLVGAAFHWRFVWQFASGEVPTARSGPREDRTADEGDVPCDERRGLSPPSGRRG